MAFLCPVRIKRNKKKKQDEESIRGGPAMGRITGSASIETLVRVGLEKEAGLSPESKMVVLHDFSPCVDDELEVKRGQIVHVLYQENDWVYVISDDNKEGFIPHSYTAQFGSQLAGLALNMKKKMPRDPGTGGAGIQDPGGGGGQPPIQPPGHPARRERNNNEGKVGAGLDQSDSDSLQDMRKDVLQATPQSRTSSLLSESSSQPEVHPFYKDSYGRYIVLYCYNAQDENDLSVDRGQCVTVLNKDDPEWFWVLKSDGEEGFVPAGFIYPLDAIQKQQNLGGGGIFGNSGGSLVTAQPGIVGGQGAGGHLQINSGHQDNPGQRPYQVTPTLASPVAQQFTQLSISPQQVSSGPMSNMSSLSAPLSSVSGHNSLPGIINGNGGHHNPSSPDVVTSATQQPHQQHQQQTTTVNSHQYLGDQHQQLNSLSSAQQLSSLSSGPQMSSLTSSIQQPNSLSSVHGHQMSSLTSTQQLNSLTSTQQLNSLSSAGIRSASTNSSGPNSLSPGSGLPLHPPPVSGAGGGGSQHRGGGGSSQQGGGGSGGQGGETRYGGTELVMLYDYKAQAPDDLSVRRGDWIYADLQNQTVDGWLWAYAPKTRKYGFIPKAYARPPAMTNL